MLILTAGARKFRWIMSGTVHSPVTQLSPARATARVPSLSTSTSASTLRVYVRTHGHRERSWCIGHRADALYPLPPPNTGASTPDPCEIPSPKAPARGGCFYFDSHPPASVPLFLAKPPARERAGFCPMSKDRRADAREGRPRCSPRSRPPESDAPSL